MSIEKLRPSFTFTEDRLRELQQVVPEAFADGKINWDTLREALGEHLEDEEQEHFGLTWPGKREARRLAAMPSKGTLVPVPGEGINEGKTHNIFIEGDNLEALKLLQKSYAGQIKMIYIDPPYNVGEDRIYLDDYVEPLNAYLKSLGEIDESGQRLTTNLKSNGRYHSNWLNMIYPRLKIAKKILSKEGIIFISIDDREFPALRMVMDELFGEENFCGVIKRRAARKTAFLSSTMSDLCDYIVIYSNGELSNVLSVSTVSDPTRPVFNEGNKITSRMINSGTQAKCRDGLYKKGIYKTKSIEFNLLSDLEIKDGLTINGVQITGPWRVNQEILNKSVYITSNFGLRRYVLDEEKEKAKALNDLLDDSSCYNEKGSEQLEEIFGIKNIFDNPKPVDLVKYLIKAAGLDSEDLIMDFFAGSGTTAQAVFETNFESQSNLRFILIQFPEETKPDSPAIKAGYASIAEICKDRIRKIINKFVPEGGQDENLSFRCLKLDNSHFQEWESKNSVDASQLVMSFTAAENPLLSGWIPDNLLGEIFLLQGFPLDSAIYVLPAFHENTIQEVTHAFCAHKLYVCLDEKITDVTVEAISIRPEDIFVCLDTALTDEAKLRLSDRCQLKVI